MAGGSGAGRMMSHCACRHALLFERWVPHCNTCLGGYRLTPAVVGAQEIRCVNLNRRELVLGSSSEALRMVCLLALTEPSSLATVIVSMDTVSAVSDSSQQRLKRQTGKYRCHLTNMPIALAIVSIVQELCESRGGRPGLSVLTSLLVSVDVKLY